MVSVNLSQMRLGVGSPELLELQNTINSLIVALIKAWQQEGMDLALELENVCRATQDKVKHTWLVLAEELARVKRKGEYITQLEAIVATVSHSQVSLTRIGRETDHLAQQPDLIEH